MQVSHRYNIFILLSIFRILTEQLRREATIQRMPVTQAVTDIIKFITDNQSQDFLAVGFPNQKSNPFRERSTCFFL